MVSGARRLRRSSVQNKGVLGLPAIAVSCGHFCGVNAALRGTVRGCARGWAPGRVALDSTGQFAENRCQP